LIVQNFPNDQSAVPIGATCLSNLEDEKFIKCRTQADHTNINTASQAAKTTTTLQ